MVCAIACLAFYTGQVSAEANQSESRIHALIRKAKEEGYELRRQGDIPYNLILQVPAKPRRAALHPAVETAKENSSLKEVRKYMLDNYGDQFTFPQWQKVIRANGTERKSICEAYIDKYSKIAKSEMEKFGIPASITLAQGLIESASGTSPLAVGYNNHFGVKNFDKNKRTTGAPYHDDCCKSRKCKNPDYFRKYFSVWESFRHHSQFLKKGERYQFLFKSTDWKHWASGLDKAGYATADYYAEMLTYFIVLYELDKYDTEYKKP